MTISRFKICILLLVVAVPSGAFGWWLRPQYIEHARVIGGREASEIAVACKVPGWALYFDHDGRRQTYGQGPSRPEYAGIYMQSNYGVCPTPDERRSMACTRNQAQQRGYRFFRELRTGEPCEDG